MQDLYYRDLGQDQDQALVLLHSGGMSGEEWKPQLASWQEHFRLIVPDLPGHGCSPLNAERLAVGAMGRAVLALLDELEIASAHLLGSSLGGAVALWLTANYPERVAKLILYRVGYRKDSASHSGSQNMADPDYWRSVGMVDWLSRTHQEQGGPDAWKSVIKRVAEALDPATSDHAHSLETLRAITQPTLLAVGDRDPLVPLPQVLEMYEAMPNAGLWLLPYSTHVAATNTWRSDCFAAEVMRFLQGRGVVRS